MMNYADDMFSLTLILVASHNYNTSAAYGRGINVTTNTPRIETGCFQLQSRKDMRGCLKIPLNPSGPVRGPDNGRLLISH